MSLHTRLSVALACITLIGCVHLDSKVQPISERKCQKRMAGFTSPSHLKDYTAARDARNYADALAIIRTEIANPAAPTDERYLVQIYSIGIVALTNVAQESGATPAMDAEVLGYHDRATALCLEELERGNLAHTVAMYYSGSRRNGVALKWIYEERVVWAGGHDEYRRINATDSLATVYGEMGQLGMRDRYRGEALAGASVYFGVPGNPTAPADGNQWVGYLHILMKHMGDVADAGSTHDELVRTWERAQTIAKRYVTPEYPTYSLAALYFATAGDTARATQLLAEAHTYEAGERAKITRADSDLACQEALILTAEHQYTTAETKFGTCSALRKQAKVREDDPEVFAGLGVTEENLGKLDDATRAYDAAIGVFEQMRGAYELASRGAFFANPIFRKSYLGKLRVLVRRAERDQTLLLEALRAAEELRARQFVDMLASKGQQVHPLDDLASVRARLGPADAIVSYTMMDTSFALIVITKDGGAAKLVDYDAVRLGEHIQAARDGLTRPDSDLKALSTELDAIATLFAKPVARMVGAKRRLIVLPDGPLNTIPFDLLATRGIGPDVTVTLTPSVTYFVSAPHPAAATEKKSFFGVGDPTYPAALHIAGIPDSAIGNVVIPPLPETKREVTGIAAQFGDASKLLLGAAATPEAVKTQDLSHFSFIHFATHGVLGGEFPGLDEPSLVLASSGQAEPLLRASDAAKLKLDADLTVLSACDTGSGQYVTGEGVLGMGRAFLLAGSRAVVMSLWAVDSQATERLMTLFYQNLAKGQTAPVALRQAKLTLQGMAHDASYDDRGLIRSSKQTPLHAAAAAMAHPFFWSAFVLVGGPDR